MRENAEVYVAFIGQPPRADYARNFFGHIAGKIPGARNYRKEIGRWAERGFEGNELRNFPPNIPRAIARVFCLTGPLPIDKCVMNYEINGNQGTLVEGFYSIPYTTAQILNPVNGALVKREALRVLRVAYRQGAAIIGLGAAMKSGKVFDSGDYFVGKTPAPISNGNNYTIGSCIEVALAACNTMGIELENATTAIVGANGSIGRICAEIMGGYGSRLILFGRKESGIGKLEERAEIIRADVRRVYGHELEIRVSVDLEQDLRKTDLILSATDSEKPVITANIVKRGAVVVDIARPHDTKRKDKQAFIDAGVLVTDGGIVYHDGNIHFKSMKLEPNYGLACSFEPAILGIAHARGQLAELSDWVETSIENVRLVKSLAESNGFVVDTKTFRFHYEPIAQQTLEAILRNTGK